MLEASHRDIRDLPRMRQTRERRHPNDLLRPAYHDTNLDPRPLNGDLEEPPLPRNTSIGDRRSVQTPSPIELATCGLTSKDAANGSGTSIATEAQGLQAPDFSRGDYDIPGPTRSL